ncbi:uncharacterized protein [Triticum aestivum]|uniref:uncharacterized protein n=1 Tax=Triticum aestivum TaxID=4565 RepID=UPI001D007126|nr:uncharacterized protein LOC123185745 [Triticum aestivum]
MAWSISWSSLRILTAGLTWKMDSDLFAQWLGLSAGDAPQASGEASSVHGQVQGEGHEPADAEAAAALEVLADGAVQVDFGLEVAGEVLLEVVADPDPDTENAYAGAEPPSLEEFEESVMVWPSDDQSEDQDEVCSSSVKCRRLE